MTFEEWWYKNAHHMMAHLNEDGTILTRQKVAEIAWENGRFAGIEEAREWTAREWADAPDKDDDLPENAGEMLWAMQGAPDKECICTQLTSIEPTVNPDCPIHGSWTEANIPSGAPDKE